MRFTSTVKPLRWQASVSWLKPYFTACENICFSCSGIITCSYPNTVEIVNHLILIYCFSTQFEHSNCLPSQVFFIQSHTFIQHFYFLFKQYQYVAKKGKKEGCIPVYQSFTWTEDSGINPSTWATVFRFHLGLRLWYLCDHFHILFLFAPSTDQFSSWKSIMFFIH